MKNKKYQILIIEDSALSVQILKDMIEQLPFPGEKESQIYTNADDALAYLNEKVQSGDFLPDLIVLDLELPGEHGLEFLKKIKTHEIYNTIPVIIYSCSAKAQDMVESYQRGGLIYMRKTSDEQAFADVVHRIKMLNIAKK